jgi:hypothetical protein
MAMKKSLVIFLFCFSVYTYGQSSRLFLMQGNWRGFGNEDATIFKIVKANKCLEFAFPPKSDEVDAVFELIIGFQNYITSSSYDSLYLKIDSLRSNGLYYTEILNKSYISEHGVVERPNFLIPSYYECEGNMLSINDGRLFEFEKIEVLPLKVIRKLYHKGKLNKRDYLKDYLDVKATSIKTLRCVIYSNPNKQTARRLNKDDIVIVTDEAGKWLKIKYGESEIGWIKRADANESLK